MDTTKIISNLNTINVDYETHRIYDNDDKQLIQWNPMKLSNKNLIGYAVIMLKCKIDSFILGTKNNKNNDIELEIDYVNKMFVYKSKLAHNASHHRYIYWNMYKEFRFDRDVYFLQKEIGNMMNN